MRNLRLLLLLPLLIAAKKSATPVTFLGIDYSQAAFIGTTDFSDPAAIFPGYLNTWNQLWADEIMEDMNKAVGPVTLENEATFETNKKATADQIKREDGPESWVNETDITDERLGALVKGYALKETSGLGLVLVVDRYVKLQQTGCTWIVYFDIATRGITAKERVCKEASGFGFRNYWFRTEKELLPEIKSLKP